MSLMALQDLQFKTRCALAWAFCHCSHRSRAGESWLLIQHKPAARY